MIPKHILQSRLLVTGPGKGKERVTPCEEACALVAVSGHQYVKLFFKIKNSWFSEFL